MKAESSAGLYKAPRTNVSQNQGRFRIHLNFPGHNHPETDDHGYGPLATVVESFMDPDTLIGMHPHRNEEIISWVPAGVMRHDDGEGNRLVTDSEHLLVMNAGSGFWHEERTLPDDPPLRMLQIFVRPHSLDLEPDIQYGSIEPAVENEWRHLFGPGDSDAPFYVRNEVDLYDARVAADASVELPSMPGRDTYFYVFEGAVEVGGVTFGHTESGLLVDDDDLTLTATEPSILVAFPIDPDAPITKQGTIGRQSLEDWTSARLLENATNAVGGSSSGHRALEYPLWRVMTEGGPSHTSGHVETYAKRLRETGRTTHADTVESREGVVSRSVASALADED